MQTYANQVYEIAAPEPELNQMFQITGVPTINQGIGVAFQLPPLPGSSGFLVQFVITTTEPFQNLNDVAQAVLAKALSQHAFFFADVDLKGRCSHCSSFQACTC